jgi:hypothetical protein
VVQEIPAEWLPVSCETNGPAGAIGRDSQFQLEEYRNMVKTYSFVSLYDATVIQPP